MLQHAIRARPLACDVAPVPFSAPIDIEHDIDHLLDEQFSRGVSPAERTWVGLCRVLSLTVSADFQWQRFLYSSVSAIILHRHLIVCFQFE